MVALVAIVVLVATVLALLLYGDAIFGESRVPRREFDSAVDLLREVALGHPDFPNIEAFLEINDPSWP